MLKLQFCSELQVIVVAIDIELFVKSAVITTLEWLLAVQYNSMYQVGLFLANMIKTHCPKCEYQAYQLTYQLITIIVVQLSIDIVEVQLELGIVQVFVAFGTPVRNAQIHQVFPLLQLQFFVVFKTNIPIAIKLFVKN